LKDKPILLRFNFTKTRELFKIYKMNRGEYSDMIKPKKYLRELWSYDG